MPPSRNDSLVLPLISSPVKSSKPLPYYLVLLLLFLEYGRPQDSYISGLAAIKPSLIVSICVVLSLVFGSTASYFADKPTKLFGSLLVFMIFHIFFARNNHWAFNTAQTMALTFVLYVGILAFVDSYEKFKTLITVWITIHIFLAISAIRSGGVGIGGFLLDENDFAITINMIIPYAYFCMFSDGKTKYKIFHLASLFVFLAASLATRSRGGLLGLLAIGICCWLRSSKKFGAACLLFLFALFALNFAPEGYWERMNTIQQEYSGEKVGSGAERQYEWEVGWKMFLANPIVGVGQGNFPWEFNNYEEGDKFQGRSVAGRAAHSLYYTLLPELGLVGTLMFLGMNYLIYKDLAFVKRLYGDKRRQVESREARFLFYSACALEASLIGFLVGGTFISVLYYPNFWILMGFVVALKKIALAKQKDILVLDNYTC
jgi:probable O-glycosylation ligase (exosortase A-associated)